MARDPPAFWTLVLGSPGRPRSIVGVAVFAAAMLLLAVPCAWMTQRFGNPVFHNPLARRLALRTDYNASGVRVAYMLGVVLAMLPILAALGLAAHFGSSWLGRAAPEITAFLQRHFD